MEMTRETVALLLRVIGGYYRNSFSSLLSLPPTRKVCLAEAKVAGFQVGRFFSLGAYS